MKCSCCDVILSTRESVRKFKSSGEYVDMCDKCLSTISDDVTVIEGKVTEDNEYNDYE
jgi:hypothetical protein